MALKIILGAVCGVLCKFVCGLIVRKLLEKRGREYSEGKTEAVIATAATALACAAVFCLVPASAETVYLLILVCIAEIVTVTDIHARIIPNDMVLALMAVTLAFGIPSMLGAEGFPEFSIGRALLGFAVCFLIFSLPAFFSKKVGAGDVKLAAAAGLCLGVWNSLICVALMGVLVIVYTFAQRKIPSLDFVKSMIPMGPFLSVSMVAVLILLKVPAFASVFGTFPF